MVGWTCRSVRYLFERMSSAEPTTFTIRASFLEIYNEQVRDLWHPEATGNFGSLAIREYPPGYWRGFYVEVPPPCILH